MTIPCRACACDLFEVKTIDGLCWLVCTFCGATKSHDAIPVSNGFRGFLGWRTGSELHRMTNADGLDGRRMHSMILGA